MNYLIRIVFKEEIFIDTYFKQSSNYIDNKEIFKG